MSNKILKERESKSGKGIKIIFAVGLLVIIILLSVIIFLLVNKDNEADKEKKRNIVVNPDNIENVISQISNDDQKIPVGSYEVTMNSTWKFANGREASENAYVENARSNTNDVYFDITRSDTEENIFSSPILPVGSHLENITLDKDLAAGTYNCIITYYLLDSDGNTESSVSLNMTIVVEQ